MYFFDKNEAFKNNIICIHDNGEEFTYGQLWDKGDELTAAISERSLVLLLAGNDPQSLCAYLALLRKRCPVILMGSKSDAAHIDGMLNTYKPNYIVENGEAKLFCEEPVEMDPELGLLLSTSGSTGAQKLVRLSYDNLQANCESIVEYLGLTAAERPVTTLPIEYTYGLSVIHSHVAVGAAIVLTDMTFFQREFWELVEKQNVTSMAGVPYSYQMLDRLHIETMDLPALKTLTQAGGHLKVELHEKLARWAAETGRQFFVMYGQTEATARMSYVPPARCLDKIGSIGIPVPGGRIELLDEGDKYIDEPNVNGELIYFGANVSLGYAVCQEDLAKADENNGRLETGDIAYRDEEGYLYISGRKKRFVKLYGKRMSLDQIQEELSEAFAGADIVCTRDDEKGITVWTTDAKALADIELLFMEKWGIKAAMVSVKEIESIPRNTSGKVIYADLK